MKKTLMSLTLISAAAFSVSASAADTASNDTNAVFSQASQHQLSKLVGVEMMATKGAAWQKTNSCVVQPVGKYPSSSHVGSKPQGEVIRPSTGTGIHHIASSETISLKPVVHHIPASTTTSLKPIRCIEHRY